jgi:diguanylate cyclase (GGDEF)-like protein
LFFIDLDRFKEVNDRFGHDAGDALLKCIAERLRRSSCGADRLYRVGGDEFTLLMPGATEKSARLMAERLMGVMQSPIKIEQVSIDFVGLSIGIALYPEQAEDAADLLRAADQAKQRRGRARLYTP